MAHKMGLVKINRSNKAGVYSEKYYLTGEKSTYNWIHNSTTSTVYSSTTFTNQTNKPLISSNVCYYIVKGSGTISADNEFPTDDNGNGWSIPSATLGTVSSGNYKETTAPTPTLTAKTWTVYTITAGDIFYSDRTMSHQSANLYAGKTPIGIVVYVNDGSAIGNAATEKTITKNRKSNTTISVGHGLVMCLMNSSGEPLTISTTPTMGIGGVAWSNLSTPYSNDYFKGNPSSQDPNYDNESVWETPTYYPGYTRTYNMHTNGDYPAATSAFNYSSIVAPNTTTGWFLPSAGQWRLIFAGLTSYKNLKYGVRSQDENSVWTADYLAMQINSYLSKVGSGKYHEIPKSANHNYHTSSEVYGIYLSRSGSCCIDFYSSGCAMDYWATFTNKANVRPVLAF